MKTYDESESGMNNTIQSSHITQHYEYIVHDTLLVLDFLRQIEGDVKVWVKTGYWYFFVVVIEV